MKRPSAPAATAASIDRLRPFARGGAPLLGRGEHGARERDSGAGRVRASEGRSPVAIEIANGTTAPQATIGETMLIVPTASAR